MKKLYFVKYMLLSWPTYGGDNLVELTDQEVADLELIFEASKRELKIAAWSIDEAKPLNATAIKDMIASDIHEQNELYRRVEEGKAP